MPVKVVPIKKDGVRDGGGWAAFCPACGYPHIFDKRWTFNGDEANPSFNPSMRVLSKDAQLRYTGCHSFLKDGKWQYLDDCLHHLKGQTVEVPEFRWH
jgi:hypothetical protein